MARSIETVRPDNSSRLYRLNVKHDSHLATKQVEQDRNAFVVRDAIAKAELVGKRSAQNDNGIHGLRKILASNLDKAVRILLALKGLDDAGGKRGRLISKTYDIADTDRRAN